MERSRAEKDFEAEHLADVQFHSAIVAASNNSTLIHMMASIYDLTKRGVFAERLTMLVAKSTRSIVKLRIAFLKVMPKAPPPQDFTSIL